MWSILSEAIKLAGDKTVFWTQVRVLPDLSSFLHTTQRWKIGSIYAEPRSLHSGNKSYDYLSAIMHCYNIANKK